MLSGIAGRLHFYGAAVAEDLGQPITLPPKPAPLTPEGDRRREEPPGLTRALQLVEIGLRNEGARVELCRAA